MPPATCSEQCQNEKPSSNRCAIPACFGWRVWYKAGLPFFQGDVTDINAEILLIDLDKRQPLPPTVPIWNILSIRKQC
ncbi:hypothetical protein J6590_012607 [Homalodisca vitripennis]|nr:hypothetical protein J6590_012607 [Homalodisca vitripennis]